MANPLYIIGSTTAPVDKATPVDGDNLPLLDSADSSKLKKLTWAHAKSTLKTYFDTLYQASGTYVTSVTGTSPVASSGGTTPAISLASGYGDTQNPYASKTANYFLSAPNGSAGVPTFRAIVAADIPTLNQNTSGTAAGLSATLATTSGGTGLTSFTANGVIFASSTFALSTSTTLNFDGTNLGLGATAASGSGSSSWISLGGTALGGISGGVIYYTGSTAEAYQYVYGGYLNHQAQTGIGHKFFVSSNATASFTIDTSQNVTVTSGNLVIGTSGKGIDFSATGQAGGMTSELLNDYEEGTWTPSISVNSGTATSYSTVEGYYRKVGSQVTVWGKFFPIGGTFGNGTGYCKISGLPFAGVSTYGVGAIRNANNLNPTESGTCVVMPTTTDVYTNGFSITVGNACGFTLTYMV